MKKTRNKFAKDLIGQRFSRLVILEEVERDKHGFRRYLCKCDCGKEKVIDRNALTQGATKSCGCFSKEETSKRMSQGWDKIFTKEFLTKEHIGNKKSLREIGREQGCSIGCIMKYMIKHGLDANTQMYELEGMKFGRLAVLSFAYIKDANTYWNVRCDCGVEKTIPGRSMVINKVISCGCYNHDKNWKGFGNISGNYWSRVIIGAKNRNLSFNITIEDAWNLFLKQDGKCALTGKTIIIDKGSSQSYHNKNIIQTASLDRIDSSKGYELDNIQWVHATVNLMKTNLNQEEFINLCKLINNHRNSK